MGDFARHVIGTDHPGQFDWRGRELADTSLTPEEETEAFRESIPDSNRQALSAFENALENRPRVRWLLARREEGRGSEALEEETGPVAARLDTLAAQVTEGLSDS